MRRFHCSIARMYIAPSDLFQKEGTEVCKHPGDIRPHSGKKTNYVSTSHSFHGYIYSTLNFTYCGSFVSLVYGGCGLELYLHTVPIGVLLK